MKLIKRTKKGFTIVELVIVIAVIAVLAAVLIPTFINLTNKANKAADDSLVTSLNKALAIEEVDHDVDNMHDAVECLKREGYLTSTLVTKSNQKLLYSLEENRFLLEEDKNEGKYQGKPDYKFWTIQDSYDSSKQQYSIYAADNFNVAAVSGLKVGFDAGDCKNITSVAYVGVGETQNIVIRTNSASTTLTINAEDDTVNHFDALGKLVVTAVDDDCYYEFGDTAYAVLNKGTVVAKDGGNINVLYVSPSAAANTKALEDKGTIGVGYASSSAVASANVAAGGISLDSSKTPEAVEEIGIGAVDKAQEKEVVANQKENNVLYQARIGTKGFETIKDAIETALDGDKIVLMSDLTRGINHSSSANKFAATRNPGYPITYKDAVITIDFNGHSINDGGVCCFPTPDSNQTIIYKNSGESESVYEHESSTTPIGNGGNSIVNGGTFISHRENNMDTLIGCSNGCSTIINNGTFRAPLVEPENTAPGKSYNQYSAAAVIKITHGEITINGGDFTGNIVKGKFGQGVLTINGGTFHNFRIIATPGEGNSQQTVAIKGGSFDADPSEYVDTTNYNVTEDNGVWSVTAK